MTRIIWRRAHPVRLPDRATPVHRELLDAYIIDHIAKDLEASLLLEQDEQKRERV